MIERPAVVNAAQKSSFNQEVSLLQVECEATNRDRDILPVFFVEMSPPDCVQSIWNLEEVDKGVYQLLGYWTEAVQAYNSVTSSYHVCLLNSRYTNSLQKLCTCISQSLFQSSLQVLRMKRSIFLKL